MKQEERRKEEENKETMSLAEANKIILVKMVRQVPTNF